MPPHCAQPLPLAPGAPGNESLHLNLEAFVKCFALFLKPRGGLGAAWWPSAWAASSIGDQSYISLSAPDVDAMEVLQRAAASLHTVRRTPLAKGARFPKPLPLRMCCLV